MLRLRPSKSRHDLKKDKPQISIHPGRRRLHSSATHCDRFRDGVRWLHTHHRPQIAQPTAMGSAQAAARNPDRRAHVECDALPADAESRADCRGALQSPEPAQQGRNVSRPLRARRRPWQRWLRGSARPLPVPRSRRTVEKEPLPRGARGVSRKRHRKARGSPRLRLRLVDFGQTEQPVQVPHPPHERRQQGRRPAPLLLRRMEVDGGAPHSNQLQTHDCAPTKNHRIPSQAQWIWCGFADCPPLFAHALTCTLTTGGSTCCASSRTRRWSS